MSFGKVYSAAKSSITTLTNIAISNGMMFTVQVVPLVNSDGEFPPSDEVYEFIEVYIKDTMKFKALNERALEGMKKKWEQTNTGPFVAKKQPSEILVALIAPSDEGIHLFYSVPKSMQFKVPHGHSQSRWELDNRTIHYSPIKTPSGTTTFKYRDELSADILKELKIQGIYVEEESDDEDMYCINDCCY